jgi:GNAT superfamily N-acetyltransferase
MKIEALRTDLKEIQSFRDLFLQENNFQIRYNACHERNWSDSYVLTIDGLKIGYGSVKGRDKLTDRDTVFEFYVLPSIRKLISQIFLELLTTSSARFIECQSNELILSSLLYETSHNIKTDVVLFKDQRLTEYKIPGIIFRNREESDSIFTHAFEPVGDYVLMKDEEVVASGGFMLHYNKPFADLYMEVKENYRGIGFGSFLIQELKRECYLSGRVPAARCNIQNGASKASLLKAGLAVCGYMLTGEINRSSIG